MSTRLDPAWSFGNLFLVKDSLAVRALPGVHFFQRASAASGARSRGAVGGGGFSPPTHAVPTVRCALLCPRPRLVSASSNTSPQKTKIPGQVMMEAGGMLEDALREYSELEAAYLEAVQASKGGTGRVCVVMVVVCVRVCI